DRSRQDQPALLARDLRLIRAARAAVRAGTRVPARLSERSTAMTRRSLRGGAAIALGALGLWLASPAGAAPGHRVMESKSDGEVVLKGVHFRVSEATVLESKEGNRISFLELPTLAGGASEDQAAVWYESTDGDAAQPILHLLKLTGATPK